MYETLKEELGLGDYKYLFTGVSFKDWNGIRKEFPHAKIYLNKYVLIWKYIRLCFKCRETYYRAIVVQMRTNLEGWDRQILNVKEFMNEWLALNINPCGY